MENGPFSPREQMIHFSQYIKKIRKSQGPSQRQVSGTNQTMIVLGQGRH